MMHQCFKKINWPSQITQSDSFNRPLSHFLFPESEAVYRYFRYYRNKLNAIKTNSWILSMMLLQPFGCSNSKQGRHPYLIFRISLHKKNLGKAWVWLIRRDKGPSTFMCSRLMHFETEDVYIISEMFLL